MALPQNVEDKIRELVAKGVLTPIPNVETAYWQLTLPAAEEVAQLRITDIWPMLAPKDTWQIVVYQNDDGPFVPQLWYTEETGPYIRLFVIHGAYRHSLVDISLLPKN